MWREKEEERERIGRKERETINYDLHLRIIQTLCLHLSHSTLLHKILTVNHYVCIEYFQQLGLTLGAGDGS